MIETKNAETKLKRRLRVKAASNRRLLRRTSKENLVPEGIVQARGLERAVRLTLGA
jgi:hypothetical protein